MRKDITQEALKEELLEFYQWFIFRNVDGANGADSNLYKAMKRDYEALLSWLEIDLKDNG